MQLDEIVVVATDAAGRNTDRSEIGAFGPRAASAAGGAGRRGQGDVAAERLLFDDPIGQSRVSIISAN